MSFDDFFRFTLGLMAALLLVFGAYALWTGRISHAGELHRRGERPADYWRELVLLVMPGIIILGWFFFVPVPAGREPAYGAMFLFAIVGPQVVRAIWAGRVEFGRTCFTPRERPFAYWIWLLIGIGLLGFGIFVVAKERGVY